VRQTDRSKTHCVNVRCNYSFSFESFLFVHIIYLFRKCVWMIMKRTATLSISILVLYLVLSPSHLGMWYKRNYTIVCGKVQPDREWLRERKKKNWKWLRMEWSETHPTKQLMTNKNFWFFSKSDHCQFEYYSWFTRGVVTFKLHHKKYYITK
jgi:hypothetical protein